MLSLYGHKKWIYAGLLLMLALVSVFLLGNLPIVTQINQSTIAYLNERRETVLTLATLSASLSTAITAIPGDVGMPLAENIADIADYLILVFAGIWIQKYLVGIASTLVFKLFIPIATCIAAANIFLQKPVLKTLIYRILLFSLLLTSIVPVSVTVSKGIEQTQNYSVVTAVENIENRSTRIIQEKEAKEKEETGFWGQLGNALNTVTDAVSNFFGKIKEDLETILAEMIESTVVLIVISCIIPAVTIWIFIWSLNRIFSTNFSPDISRINLVGNFVRKRNRERRELVYESSDD